MLGAKGASPMSRSGLALFESAIGVCGLAWGPGGLLGVQLPEEDSGRTQAHLMRRFPELDFAEPPAEAMEAMERIAAFLGGAPDDFRDLALDMAGVGSFDRNVYAEARAIPAGETITYGVLAGRLGDPAQARAVGQSLGRNPWPIIVPCHRITAAEGRMGGFSAPGGTTTKLKLLEIEGALAAEKLPLFGPVC
jgi:methylated-DNA-[protein]-cysteine S-methyltransferase